MMSRGTSAFWSSEGFASELPFCFLRGRLWFCLYHGRLLSTNQLLMGAITWMALKGIMLNKKSQHQKDTWEKKRLHDSTSIT